MEPSLNKSNGHFEQWERLQISSNLVVDLCPDLHIHNLITSCGLIEGRVDEKSRGAPRKNCSLFIQSCLMLLL